MQWAVFVRGNHVWFSVTEELAAFIPVKGTTTHADLYERAAAILGCHTETGCTSDGRSAKEQLFTNNMKNTTDRDLMISHCFLHHESSCAKLLRMANVVPLLRQI
jgi:hypothetical protein